MNYAIDIPKTEYKKEITSIFYRNTSRGFSDWRQCGSLEMDICSFLDEVCRTLSDEGRYGDLFDITNFAYTKWSDTDKDDSNGETQSFCQTVQGIWNTICEEGQADISHGKMLKWFIATLEKHSVIDYMEDGLYDFILKHFYEPDELQAKKTLLERVISASDTNKYGISVLEEYYIKILADMKAPIEEIREIVKKSDGYSIKETLAKIETNYGNYDAAIAILEERINERPGAHWSNGPRRQLIEIYKKKGDKAKGLQAMRDLLWANVDNSAILNEYKGYFSKEEWPAEWNRILERLKDMPGGIVWYGMEGRYDLIMDAIEEPPVSDVLIDEYKELDKLYPERCFKVRVESACDYVQIARKRSDYRWLARRLQKLCRYKGGAETARKLAAEFVSMYPATRAMIDELSAFL